MTSLIVLSPMILFCSAQKVVHFDHARTTFDIEILMLNLLLYQKSLSWVNFNFIPTHLIIRWVSQKPPPYTGLPAGGHSHFRRIGIYFWICPSFRVTIIPAEKKILQHLLRRKYEEKIRLMEGTLNEEQPLPLAFHIVKVPPKTSEFRHASLTTHLTAHVNRSSSRTASLFFNYCRPAWDLQRRDLTFGERILEAAVLELERRVGMEELSKVDDDRWSKRQRIYGRSKNWSLSFRIHVIIALKSFRSGGVPSPLTFCAPEFEREVIFWRRKRVFFMLFPPVFE